MKTRTLLTPRSRFLPRLTTAGLTQRFWLPPACWSALLFSAALLGCASGPVPRDWQINAFEAQETALDTWLNGNDKLAEAEFKRAREAVASSGRLDLLARLTLARCAAQVASLSALAEAQSPFCPEFSPLAVDARPEEKAYFEFLSGRWQGIVPALLPAQHRPLLAMAPAGNPAAGAGTNPATNTSGNGGGTAASALAIAAAPAAPAADAKQLAAMTDPLSRLIAGSLLLQRGQLSPDGIAVAVDTASAQGWRRPLLAWLGVQAQRADATGNRELAAQTRRRIALVGGSPVTGK